MVEADGCLWAIPEVGKGGNRRAGPCCCQATNCEKGGFFVGFVGEVRGERGQGGGVALAQQVQGGDAAHLGVGAVEARGGRIGPLAGVGVAWIGQLRGSTSDAVAVGWALTLGTALSVRAMSAMACSCGVI